MSTSLPITIEYRRNGDSRSGLQFLSMDPGSANLIKVARLATEGILESGEEGYLDHEFYPSAAGPEIFSAIMARNNRAHLPRNRSRSTGLWITLGAFDPQGTPVGMGTVYYTGRDSGRARRWFWLGKDYRKRGYGQIISRALFEISFRASCLDVNVVVCQCHPGNEASLNLINEWRPKFVGEEPSSNVPGLVFKRFELEKTQWQLVKEEMGGRQHRDGPYGHYTCEGVSEFLKRCNP